MKHILLSAVLATGLLSSCSTAYKAGQTPDDLYYSPGREIVEAKEEKAKIADGDVYQEYISSNDDRYLRMKVANREQWSSIDNYSYWNDSRYDFTNYSYSPLYAGPYSLSYGGFYSNYYSSYYLSMMNPYYLGPAWNTGFYYGCYGMGGYSSFGWGSPLYSLVSYSTPKVTGTPPPGYSNIAAYKNKSTSNSNWGYTDSHTGAFVPTSGSQSNFSSLAKRVFSSSNNNQNTSTYDRPVRSFTQSNSAPVSISSSAGGSSGGFRSTGTTATSGRSGRN